MRDVKIQVDIGHLPSEYLSTAVELHSKKLVSGVYMLYHVASGRAYFGSSWMMYQRLSAHMADLNARRHSSIKLQNAWNVYERAAFRFLLVERSPDGSTEPYLVERENFYILGREISQVRSEEEMRAIRLIRRRVVFNTNIPATVGGLRGTHVRSDVKQRIIETWRKKVEDGYVAPAKGAVLSDERKKQISEFMTGHTFNTPEVKAKISAAHKGHIRCVGTGNPNVKITEDDVREIRRLLEESNLSQEKIGRRFGINQDAVSKIKIGKAWKHIP